MHYTEAVGLMETARDADAGKPLENNTRLHRRADGYAIRLHATDVVTIHDDGTYTLDSGGWRTVTTKARINAYSPARIGSIRGVWHVFGRNGDAGSTLALYRDGMRVDAAGRPVGGVGSADDDAAYMRTAKRVDAMIAGYVRGFVAELGKGDFPAPGAGDCFGCQFVAEGEDKGSAKAGVFGVSHILEHFREGYFVPSLLWRAMQRRGNPSFVWQMVTRIPNSADIAASDLRWYLRGVRDELIGAVLRGDGDGDGDG